MRSEYWRQEQLKEGKKKTPARRFTLLASALAFVTGFSVVFISFGASASAVGSFLLRNRASLAPIAGALIVLFGLHLTGLLAKISVRAGLLIGCALVVAGIALSLRAGLLPAWLKPICISSPIAAGFFCWVRSRRSRALAQSRCSVSKSRRPAGSRQQRFPDDGFSLFAFGWTRRALHRTDPLRERSTAVAATHATPCLAGNFSALLCTLPVSRFRF